MTLKLKQMEALFDEGHCLADLLPYIEYSDDIFVLADGSLGKAWQITPWETEGRTQEYLSMLAGHLENLLTRIPTEKLACQMVLKREKGKLRPLFTMRYFPRWREPGQMQAHQADFVKYVSLVEGIFQSAGIGSSPMDGGSMAQWLYDILNPKRKRSIPRVHFNDEEPIRDQILFSSPRALAQGLVCEDVHARVVTLKELPPSTVCGMFSREFHDGNPFCLLDAASDLMIVVNFTVPPLADTLSRLQMQKSFAFMHQENWLGDKSVEAVEKKKELDETIAAMFKGAGKIVYGRWHFIVRDEDPSVCESFADAVVNGLNRFNCEGVKEDLIGASLFLTCLPLNFDPYYETFIRRAKRMSSANASHMLPLYGAFRGTKTPAQAYVNRRGEKVSVDFFDSNTNPHGMVIGASGAGKSFFMNDFILQNERLDAHFFVLDKGDSYKKLCTILGGQYMAFDLNQPITINPFANAPTPENLSFLLSLLSQMASGGDERDRLNREEEGLLHRAVLKAYEKHGVPPPGEVTLSNVTAVLNDSAFNNEFGINSLMGPTLALRLTPFTRKGPYGAFFDGPNQFKIQGRFVVFELADLSAYPDLQLAVLLNLMFFMTNFVCAADLRPKRKYLLIDEAWSLLKVKNTADFIANAFKTFRKFRCSVVAITQEIADLTRQESGIAIIANTANKIFLKQEAAVIDLLKDKLSFDEPTLQLLKTVTTIKGQFSEGLVMTDACKGVIRLAPDPFLYWAANSEPKNNDYLFKKAELCNGNFIEALRLCAREHPYGIQ